MPNRRFWRLLGVLSALGLGCGGEEGPRAGVLVIPFELGNRKDCESLAISRVRAELDEGSIVEEADCDRGEVRFNLLMPGRYDAVLFGLDDDDVEVMDSLASGLVPLDVVGRGTTVVADPAVKLTAAPARLHLRWDFGFSSCGGAGIDSFLLTAWHADGSELLLETEIACDTPGQGRGQYRGVADEDRELGGDQLGEVNVQPFDENGIAVGDPIVFVFEAPGAGRRVELSLHCDEGGCEGSGQPD
jgi:hypothetical protein